MKMSHRYFFRLLALVIILSASIPAIADVKLPAVISDNMVLQQKSRIALWGWADVGEKILIKNSWDNISSTPHSSIEVNE